MQAKLFVTGSTGYIGGDVLYEVAQAHPEYDITCLVRNSKKGAKIGSQYAKVKLVYGTLDDAKILEEEARKADVVLHCAHADHEVAATALVRGLLSHPSDRPGYLIHTSGTGILCFKDIETGIFGEASAKIYNDWDGIAEAISLPDNAPHRLVDKIVLAGGKDNPALLKTAIVCPPTIYGKGRGPDNQRSQQLPDLVKYTLIKNHGMQIGAGKTFWTNVHVADLSKCYLLLVEAAVEGHAKATWGEEGYYFTENDEHVWGNLSKLVASEAYKQGLITSDEVVSLSTDDAKRLMPRASVLWGANSRCRAVRARKLLHWKPKEESIEASIPYAVTVEAEALGLIEHHAAKTAAS